MNKKWICKTISILIITVTFILLPVSNISAKQFSLQLDGNNPILVDNADIYNDYEEVTIINELKNRRDTDGFLYIFLTTSDVSEYNPGHEIEQIYDDYYEWVTAEGTVLFLISTDPTNSFCELQGYGEAKHIIPHDICRQINSDTTEDLLNNDYQSILTTLFKDLDDVNSGEIVSTETQKNYTPQTVLILLISLIIATLIMSVIVFSRRQKGALAQNGNVHIRHLVKQDIYIRSTIRKYDL